MLLRQFERHTFDAQDLSLQSVVLDLGANVGGFSRSILDEFGCRCYAVEANPRLCAQIKAHPKLSLFNLAIAANSGTLPFHLSENPEASSLLKPSPQGAGETIEV